MKAGLDDKDLKAQIAYNEQFERAYARWLHARAIACDPDQKQSDEIVEQQTDQAETAAIDFLVMPAPGE